MTFDIFLIVISSVLFLSLEVILTIFSIMAWVNKDIQMGIIYTVISVILPIIITLICLCIYISNSKRISSASPVSQISQRSRLSNDGSIIEVQTI